MFTAWSARVQHHTEAPCLVAYNCLELQLQWGPVPLASLGACTLVHTSTHTHTDIIKNKKSTLKKEAPRCPEQ